MNRERFLRPVQYVCFLGAISGIGMGLKGSIDGGYLDNEITNKRTPLVEQYRRDWAAMQSDQMRQDFIVRPDRFSILRDTYVEEQITQNHPETEDLNNKRRDILNLGYFGVVMGTLGIMSGLIIANHRYQKERESRRMRVGLRTA
jgi:hypothetical protein